MSTYNQAQDLLALYVRVVGRAGMDEREAAKAIAPAVFANVTDKGDACWEDLFSDWEMDHGGGGGTDWDTLAEAGLSCDR